MNRIISIVAWGLLGALAFIIFNFIYTILSIRSILSGPDPETVLAKARPVGERSIVALEERHRRHGSYPQELSDLVKEGLLDEVPELPSHWGTTSRYGPSYEVNNSLDFYRLSFGYMFEAAMDAYWQEYISDDPGGWKTTGSLEGMEDLVADRVLATYRKRQDGKSLDLFMSDVIGKADCEYLSRNRVIRWLGEGTDIGLPPDLFGAGKKGYAYQAQDDAKRRYCFVYKDHWLPHLKSYLPAEERAKYPENKKSRNHDDAFVDKNYPVLDKLFLIQESGDRPTWTVVRECPKSPRDKPSGRHQMVDESLEKP